MIGEELLTIISDRCPWTRNDVGEFAAVMAGGLSGCGTCETSTMSAVRSASGVQIGNTCSLRDLPVLTNAVENDFRGFSEQY